MTPTTSSPPDAAARVQALRRAALRATLAPSVHNTQPWRFVLRPDALHVVADRDRQLHVLDASGRQLMISLGAALFNARVSLAHDGMAVTVERFPDRRHPDLAAVVSLAPRGEVAPALAELDPYVSTRATNRRRFVDEAVPESVLEVLRAAAVAEGADLAVIDTADDRLTVATLSQHADDIENLNPAYRAELRRWTSDAPDSLDGVRPLVVPHVDGSAHDEVPIRDFDTRGEGYLPGGTHSSMLQTLVLLTTVGDSHEAWLRSGEALERVLLEVDRFGLQTSPLTQVTEVPSARSQLRLELRMQQWPQVLLRIGRAPATPSSRRRRLADVLVEQLDGRDL
ncbi:nitroreductase family protein [Jatrophihabitans fulvus]